MAQLPSHFSRSDQTKLLGVHIDSNMSFKSHIEHVCEKLNRAYYAIFHLKSCLSQDALITVYDATVHSYLSYNITCWGQSSGYIRVFRALKRILRMIFNLRYHENCRTSFKVKKILTLVSIFILKCVSYVKKHLSMFEVQGDNQHYNARCTTLKIPKFT
ncbi:unnamed protein product [Callosobruchus maculatus]|uniref:Alkylated DNA repair protein AlkB homologue 8 N-terminal domain-containing protein n=1 Tax=Callosobruchus maculatus TaxID=64391 RepID=A0A653CRW7_CALMS|nr:unnamed protein product [Callosobruchus maculatus]